MRPPRMGGCPPVRFTCLRDAGCGTVDLRDFTRLLRNRTPDAADRRDVRVTFLRPRHEELAQRRRAVAAALAVLDDAITYDATHG